MDSHGLTLDAPVGGLCFRRDDNVWAAEGEGRSRFPEGMTERNANANANAKAKAKAEAEAEAEAGPCGMTARKARAKTRVSAVRKSCALRLGLEGG